MAGILRKTCCRKDCKIKCLECESVLLKLEEWESLLGVMWNLEV